MSGISVMRSAGIKTASAAGRAARRYLPPRVKRAGRAMLQALEGNAEPEPQPAVEVAPPAPTTMRLLHTAQDVTNFVADVNPFAGDDYPRFLDLANHAQFVLPQPVPDDPFSTEYRDYQLELWKTVSGRDTYDPALCEADNNVSVEVGLRLPFPHVTRDSATVGNYYLLLGWILRNLECAPGSRVVEFGAGWGHVTDALVRSGLDVTVVDIEKTFLELIEARCDRDDLSVTIHHGTFDSLPPSSGPYDIAIFSECFHHALDHIAVIRLLSEIVRPGGRVLFAAEPFSDSAPVPWGLRLDGHALWATRNFGWMELGFTETYIRDLLDVHGFDFERRDLEGIGPFGTLVIATRRAA